MGVSRSLYQRKIDRINEDAANGVIQSLVDSGWTILGIARKYEVSESKIRGLGKKYGGVVEFKNGKMGKKYEKAHLSDWSDAKRLAMTGKW